MFDEQQNIKALAHFICNGKHALYLKVTNFDKSANNGDLHLFSFKCLCKFTFCVNELEHILHINDILL